MPDRKSVLCIVPLPPPVTGAAFVSESIVNHLKQDYTVDVIQYQRGDLVSGKFSLKQFFKIIIICLKLLLVYRWTDYDRVYLAISSSWFGHHRDLLILYCLGLRLRRKTVLHLHSAALTQDMSSISSRIFKKIAERLFSGVQKGIVVGESWSQIYGGLLAGDQVKILKNFFEPYLLISESDIHKKFNSMDKINILFLSNLVREKGPECLLDAFLSLPQTTREKALLHFAGNLCSGPETGKLLNKIEGEPDIFYHGMVSGGEKRKLLAGTHILCFPTYHRYETQGIVILEAYAAGCMVITTDNGGIKDVFADKVNGLLCDIHIGDEEIDTALLTGDLREKLIIAIENMDGYKDVALQNRREAIKKYSKEIFFRNFDKILFN